MRALFEEWVDPLMVSRYSGLIGKQWKVGGGTYMEELYPGCYILP